MMTEGPLGFPMDDQAASDLEAVLRALPPGPEFAYRKSISDRVPTDLLIGERADISWITTEGPDRGHEVVRSTGMDDRQYQLNPIVTLNHAYHLPPVGRSIWRQPALTADRRGIKAKTHYPPRPDEWADGPWPPDAAFSLVQAGLLRGKSIGFLPTKVHTPRPSEREQAGWQDVELVIDEWLLLEYACCFLPCQQDAVVEAVSKSLPVPEGFLEAAGLMLPDGIPFTPLEEVEKALHRALSRLDLAGLTGEVLAAQLDRRWGRV